MVIQVTFFFLLENLTKNNNKIAVHRPQKTINHKFKMTLSIINQIILVK